MKKTLFLLFFTVAVLSAGAAGPFVCTEPGTVFEYEIKSSGKVAGYQITTLTASERDGEDTLLTFSTEQLDEKRDAVELNGVILQKSVYTGRLTPTEYIVSVKDAISSNLVDGLLQSGVDDIDIECDDTVLPNELNVGDAIRDYYMNMHLTVDGKTVTLKIWTVGNKVTARETVTTPAGTFDCYKVFCKMKIKLPILGLSLGYESTQWLAEGVGTVRMDSKMAGQKVSYTLVKIEKTEIVNQ